MDNQAWVSLTDAQTLLGWGQDVSVYIIPDEGILRDGDTLPGGLAVTHKGENLRLIAAQYQPLLNVWEIVSFTLGIAASITLANVLWRLALIRRHDMAILRTTGFPTASIASYLLIQAAGVTLIGILIGGLFTMILATSIQLTVSSFTIIPRLDASTLLPGLGWIGAIMLVGSLVPAIWMSQLNLAQLLHSE
jgi:ABC-type antimicrobial peptide transport system permease subunit